jgi:phage tail protein X
MSEATTLAVRAREHDTLDTLAWRHVTRTAGVVEATLAATPGLAASAADLGAGQAVTLVIAPAPPAPLVQLWN